MAERPKKEQPGTRHESGDRLSTAPPPFDMQEYARSSESMLAAEPVEEPQRKVLRPTAPPDATYEELLDSCSEPMRAASPVGSTLDGEDSSSEGRVVSSTPAVGQPTLPSVESIPTLAVPKDDLEWFGLDEGAQMLVAFVNGHDSIQAIAMNARVDPTEAQQLFAELALAGAVDLR
jgi:hypothetical protein